MSECPDNTAQRGSSNKAAQYPTQRGLHTDNGDPTGCLYQQFTNLCSLLSQKRDQNRLRVLVVFKDETEVDVIASQLQQVLLMEIQSQ